MLDRLDRESNAGISRRGQRWTVVGPEVREVGPRTLTNNIGEVGEGGLNRYKLRVVDRWDNEFFHAAKLRGKDA